jgi:8-oxo-dGTP pyrophosphatase MutT (NUDIX family)
MEFSSMIRKLQAEKEYRPTAVAVLYSGNRFLITKSPQSPVAWSFPQEGVEEGESLIDALQRGLNEELGMNFKSDVDQVVPGYHCEKLNAEASRPDKRGFSKGKAYFFSIGQYVGNGVFRPKKDEVEDFRWLNYVETMDHFNARRPELASLLKRGLDNGIELVDLRPR